MTTDRAGRGGAEPGGLGRLLDETARYERELIEASRSIDGSADPARVEEVLERTWRGERSVARRRRWLAAAAVLLVGSALGWLLPRASDRDGPAGVHVGQNRPELVAPVGEVPRFDAIRWRGTSRDASLRYRVRVVALPSRDLLLERGDLPGTELSLEDVPTDSWDTIEIELEEFDAGGSSVGVERAWARRSGR